MLLEDVRGKAVGIDLCLAFGIGEDIDLAVRLFEWLLDIVIFEPLSL
jgi:hypothetical protein